MLKWLLTIYYIYYSVVIYKEVNYETIDKLCDTISCGMHQWYGSGTFSKD